MEITEEFYKTSIFLAIQSGDCVANIDAFINKNASYDVFVFERTFLEQSIGYYILPDLWKHTFSGAKAVNRTRISMSSLTAVTPSHSKANDMAVFTVNTSAFFEAYLVSTPDRRNSHRNNNKKKRSFFFLFHSSIVSSLASKKTRTKRKEHTTSSFSTFLAFLIKLQLDNI